MYRLEIGPKDLDKLGLNPARKARPTYNADLGYSGRSERR